MQEQWDQAGLILQGGIERGLVSPSPEDREDAAKMAAALTEIHVLRRYWPQAVDTASQFVAPASGTSGQVAISQSMPEQNIFRLAAAAIVAQVRELYFMSNSRH